MYRYRKNRLIIGMCCAAAALALLFASADEKEATDAFLLSGSEKKYLSSIRQTPITIAYSYDLLYSKLSGGTGMLRPLADLLRDKFGLAVEMKKLDRKSAMAQLEEGSVDFYGLVGIDKERRKKYFAPDTLFQTDGKVVSRAGSPVGAAESLRNRRVGLLEGAINGDKVAEYLRPNGQVVYYSSMPAMISGLVGGEIDSFGTADNAELEVLAHPEIRYQFTAPNFQMHQSLISRQERLKPLIAIIDRYLGTAGGARLRSDIRSAREKALLDAERKRLAKNIAYVARRYAKIYMYDTGALYPLCFDENGKHKGLQVDINAVFEKLTGIPVEIKTEVSSVKTAAEGFQSGQYQVISSTYFNLDRARIPDLAYSIPVWTDRIRTYSYGKEVGNLNGARIGTTASSAMYINWDALAGRDPEIYPTRARLMEALKKGGIDVAFVSEMAFNYYYSILGDYKLREMGETSVEADMQMIYSAKTPELNNLFDEAIMLYQVLYPQGRAQWVNAAERYQSDLIRVRDRQQTYMYRAAAVIAGLIGLLLYSHWRYVRYDRLVTQMILKQQNFDLLWGNLRTGRVVSKGKYPFLRKWGFTFENVPTKMNEMSRAFNWDVRKDYEAEMERMRQNGTEWIVSDKIIVSPLTGENMHYRRYLHRVSDSEFVSLAQDTTDEVARVEKLTSIASTDYLSSLLTRRAMNDVFKEKCERCRAGTAHFYVAMFDIDNFKKVNDLHGHDVGDEVLKTVAHIIGKTEGCGGSTSRWGGEEFLTLINCRCIEEAEKKISAIVRAVAEREIKIAGTNKTFHVTISAGVAEFHCDDPDYSVQQADKALYDAKHSGKNRVCVRL